MNSHTRYCLPSRVLLQEGEIVDLALEQTHPLNETGYEIAVDLVESRTLEETAQRLQGKYQLTNSAAVAQVTDFALKLNRLNLLNVRPAPDCRPLKKRIFDFVIGNQFRHNIRTEIAHQTLLAVIVITTVILLKSWSRLLVLMYGLLTLGAILQFSSWLAWFGFIPPLFAFSIALHEAGHVAAVRYVTSSRHSYYLIVEPLSAAIVRRRSADWRDEVVISLAGPLPVASLGALGIFAGLLSESIHVILLSFPFIFHVVSLFPLWGDGRNIVTTVQRAIKSRKKSRSQN